VSTGSSLLSLLPTSQHLCSPTHLYLPSLTASKILPTLVRQCQNVISSVLSVATNHFLRCVSLFVQSEQSPSVPERAVGSCMDKWPSVTKAIASVEPSDHSLECEESFREQESKQYFRGMIPNSRFDPTPFLIPVRIVRSAVEINR